jgi:hypothetical protein
MSEISVMLDPQNPGHFYACCGLLELCEQMSPGSVASFKDDAMTSRTAIFRVEIPGQLSLDECIEALRRADVTILPHEDQKTSPVRMMGPRYDITLSWWLKWTQQDTTPLKLWAGQQCGKDILLDMVRNQPDGPAISDTLFYFSVPLKGRFGIDPRAAWLPQDCGFSPNELDLEVLTYPAVELLGAIGLQTNLILPPRAKEGIPYFLWTRDLPAITARAASMGALKELPGHHFRFPLISRGSYKAFDFAKEERK